MAAQDANSPTPLSQTSGCESSGNINFSCFKPPTWSWFVMLDQKKKPKNKYKIHFPSWDRCYDVMIRYLVHSQVWTEYTISSCAVPVGALTQLQLYLTSSSRPCLCLPPSPFPSHGLYSLVRSPGSHPSIPLNWGEQTARLQVVCLNSGFSWLLP